MQKSSVKPKGIVWRRWENGKVIANTRLSPEFEDAFGSAYYITHRAHLHSILHAKAVELGVVISLDSRIVTYNPDEPSFVLANGKVVHADFIIAADGMMIHHLLKAN
jgi:salicylate hydroxylase